MGCGLLSVCGGKADSTSNLHLLIVPMSRIDGAILPRTHPSKGFFFFKYIYSACSITLSSTTCTGGFLRCHLCTFIILTFLDASFSSYLLDLYSLSNDRLSVNFLNSLLYLLISVSLLTGQFSDRNTAALSLSLSCYCSSHSYSVWSIVSSPVLQEHLGLS